MMGHLVIQTKKALIPGMKAYILRRTKEEGQHCGGGQHWPW